MKKYLKYIIPSIIGLLFALIICLAKDVFSQEDSEEVFKILTDAFFSSGILIFCVGMLLFCANQGAFTMLSYGMRRFFSLFKRNYSRDVNDTYANYKLAKLENPKSMGYLLIVGAVFIAISLIFLIFYYRAG